LETNETAATKPSFDKEPIGRVLSVRGSQASIGLRPAGPDSPDDRTTVGKFMAIESGNAILIAVITEVTSETSTAGRELGCRASALLDLIGEIKENASGEIRFQRGVSEYPVIGDPASPITSRELEVIYNTSGADTIEIGRLQQDSSIRAYIHSEEMLKKHFAVLGTTGVGKSSGLALILQQLLWTRPELRIFLVDAHNEYGSCFGDKASVLSPRNLRLPFWLFNFEEFIDVLFGARPGVDEEVEILSELIPLAKSSYTQ
jgi:hypothetical protein